jgi:hypothetical protein
MPFLITRYSQLCWQNSLNCKCISGLLQGMILKPLRKKWFFFYFAIKKKNQVLLTSVILHTSLHTKRGITVIHPKFAGTAFALCSSI